MGNSGSCDERAVGSPGESCSGSPGVTCASSLPAFPTLCTLTPPLDVNEEGLERFDRDGDAEAEADLPRRELRERDEDDVPGEGSSSVSEPVRVSSRPVIGVEGGLSPRLDLDLAEEGDDPIGVSGTGSSAAAGCGG